MSTIAHQLVGVLNILLSLKGMGVEYRISKLHEQQLYLRSVKTKRIIISLKHQIDIMNQSSPFVFLRI